MTESTIINIINIIEDNKLHNFKVNSYKYKHCDLTRHEEQFLLNHLNIDRDYQFLYGGQVYALMYDIKTKNLTQEKINEFSLFYVLDLIDEIKNNKYSDEINIIKTMGMYTELIFGAALKKSAPPEVIDTLKYMLGEIKEKPDSDLNIHRNVLIGCSYYFGVSSPVSRLWYDDISKQWILSSRANIKNYENEIETFLKWIKPYISSGSGNREMYAMVMYEEASEPTIYYLHEEDGDHDYEDDDE